MLCVCFLIPTKTQTTNKQIKAIATYAIAFISISDLYAPSLRNHYVYDNGYFAQPNAHYAIDNRHISHDYALNRYSL